MAYQTSLQSQSIELLVAYRQNPTVQLRNRLVRLNMGLVRKVAHRMAHQCSEPYEDLEQCGSLGLIRAIERFDPSQGFALSSFAMPYIRGEILHFLRDRANTVKIPRRWQQLSRDGAKARQALMLELGRQPSDIEIAETLDVSVEEWRSTKLASSNRTPLSLNALVSMGGKDANSAMTLGDTLVDTHAQLLELNQEDRLVLQDAMAKLEDRTREMIEAVFFQQQSRQEVAQQIGVSPVTVTRHIKKGIGELVQILNQPGTPSLENAY